MNKRVHLGNSVLIYGDRLQPLHHSLHFWIRASPRRQVTVCIDRDRKHSGGPAALRHTVAVTLTALPQAFCTVTVPTDESIFGPIS